MKQNKKIKFIIVFTSVLSLITLSILQNQASGKINYFNNDTSNSTFNEDGECSEMKGGVVHFAPKSYRLDDAIKRVLNSFADEMRRYPACRGVYTGHGNGNKIEQQLSWDQVNSCIEYMVNVQRIDRERMIFIYAQNGDMGLVDLSSASPDEVGPDKVPPPFPNLR